MLPEVLEQLARENRTVLTEIESKELLRSAGIPMVDTRLARSPEEAVSLSRELGFPVVLKITSPDIIHKTEAGGVRLGLRTARQVEQAYQDILKSAREKFPQAVLPGVSVQKMAPSGVEVIMGMTKDAQFGPVLMFGLGGIMVELLKDVSFRIVPITRRDAREMMQEIKGFPLLTGFRGKPPADLRALEDMLLRLSELVEHQSEIKEIDLNPVFAYPQGALAVDARIILEKTR